MADQDTDKKDPKSKPSGAMDASQRSRDTAGTPIPATPAAQSLTPEQHRAIDEHLEAAGIRKDTAKARTESMNAAIERAKAVNGLKVRALKRGFTRELQLKEPGDLFILNDYTDLDGFTLTAEDQFSPRWMERADEEEGSREARIKKPLSDDAKEARRFARERMALEAGTPPEDRPETDTGEYQESAAVRREDARDRAATRTAPALRNVPRGTTETKQAGKRKSDEDTI